jgi:hypothetical protein
VFKQQYQMVLIVMCSVLGSISPADAGTARQLALGGDSAYFTDSANILQWYSSLANYPNQLAIELGDLSNDTESYLNSQGVMGHGGGLHAQLGNDGSWGTMAFYFQDRLDNALTDGAFNMLWSRDLGPIQIGLGGHFTTHGRSRVGTGVGDRVDSQYFHQYGLGLSGVVFSGFRLEVAGEITNTLASNSGALYDLRPTNEWSTYGFRARGFYDMNPELTLVPLVSYSREIQGDYDDVVGGPVDRDAYTTRLGLGGHLKVRPNQLLLLSCEYRSGSEYLNLRYDGAGSSAWDNSDRYFYQIRCRAGVESPVLSWLTVRASVSYIRIHDDQYRFDDGEGARTEHMVLEGVNTPIALGVGLHYQSWAADFTFNDTAPVDDELTSEELFGGSSEGYSALTLTWKF